jgi:hypothetical protein
MFNRWPSHRRRGAARALAAPGGSRSRDRAFQALAQVRGFESGKALAWADIRAAQDRVVDEERMMHDPQAGGGQVGKEIGEFSELTSRAVCRGSFSR